MKTKIFRVLLGAIAFTIWTPSIFANKSLNSKAVVESRRGGDGVGNGGNFNELTFTAMAYEFHEALVELKKRAVPTVQVDIARLKQILSQATIKGYPNPMYLRGELKHAINRPDLLLVKYDSEEWSSAAFLRRKQMVAHEILPLIGILDPDYHRSIPLIAQIDKFGLWTDRTVPSMNGPKTQSELLYSRFDDETRSGFSLQDANQICQQVKEQYDQEYFAVHCEYIEKSWGTWVPFERWSIEKHFERSSVYRSRTSWENVLKSVQESYLKTMSFHESSSFGLKVFGLGLLSELPWRVLMTSKDFGEGLGSRSFDSRRQAFAACQDLVTRLDRNSLRFYRAICRTSVDVDDQLYYYEIVTKNPMVK